MKIRKGQTIKFSYPSNLAGVPLILDGVIVGYGKEVRQKWPIECAEAPNSMLLVRRVDCCGNTYFHAISPREVVGNAKSQ